MKIAIIGMRGIPAVYGGFETFAEELSSLLSAKGYDITVQCDYNSVKIPDYNGVKLFYSTVTKTKNPFKYYFEGLKWAIKNCDIIIITGTVGSIFYFLNFFAKKIIITNTDGIESERSKWSVFQRLYLKLSEFIAVMQSDYIIADSASIKNYLQNTYGISGKKIRVIEYGAYINTTYDFAVLEKYNLTRNGYYLVVCRLEPENNLSMIIEGYEKSLASEPLVIVGPHSDNRYVKSLINNNKSEKIIFPGGIYNKSVLNSLRFSCKAYIHGHSVGGTNPSLLEAMGNRNIIICHDNVFNREVTDNSQLYFSDSADCADRIMQIEKMTDEDIERYKQKSVDRIKEYYSWDNILNKYLGLINSLELKNECHKVQ